MDYTIPPAGETKTIRTPDDRDLAYVEFGDHDAPLVIHNHGGPSSRLEGRLLASAATGNGLRLLSVDRPGNGRSSPQKDRTYEGWADDLLTIADASTNHPGRRGRGRGVSPVRTKASRRRPATAAVRTSAYCGRAGRGADPGVPAGLVRVREARTHGGITNPARAGIEVVAS